jgi:hypothetical protein
VAMTVSDGFVTRGRSLASCRALCLDRPKMIAGSFALTMILTQRQQRDGVFAG